MTKDRPRPDPGAATSLPHGEARENRQPYAAEHEDYNDRVAKPPEEQRRRESAGIQKGGASAAIAGAYTARR